MLENLQSAHYSLLKAKQQAQQLPYMSKEVMLKLESNNREQVVLLHMIADHKVQLERSLEYAQRELIVPVIYPQPRSPNPDETDEKLRDVRAKCFSAL